MEEILYIVVIFIIYSIVHVVKSVTSKNADVQGTPYTGEAFPAIDTLPEQPVTPQPAQEMAPRKATASKVVATGKENIKKQNRRNNEEKISQDVAAVQDTGERIISLKSRSAAKRAFIEAEILNRKY